VQSIVAAVPVLAVASLSILVVASVSVLVVPAATLTTPDDSGAHADGQWQCQ